MVGLVASLILFFFCSPVTGEVQKSGCAKPAAQGVPEAEEVEAQGKVQSFYVAGAVKRPGQFFFKWDSELLAHLIKEAAGTTQDAKLPECFLYRRLEDGSWQKIRVDVKAILEGKKPDVQLQKTDVISIHPRVKKEPRPIRYRVKDPPRYPLIDPPRYPVIDPPMKPPGSKKQGQSHS